jgi:hypothetical protein
MEVASSGRRFRDGFLQFFLNYKLGQYFIPYWCDKLQAPSKTSHFTEDSQR